MAVRGRKRSVFGHKVAAVKAEAAELKERAEKILGSIDRLRQVESYQMGVRFPVPVNVDDVSFNDDGSVSFTYGNNESLGLLKDSLRLSDEDFQITHDVDGEYLTVAVDSPIGILEFFLKNEDAVEAESDESATLEGVADEAGEELVTA